MKQLQISNEEKLKFENSIIKIENANLIIQLEKSKQDILLTEICNRLEIKKENIINLDIQTGTITVNDEVDTK